MKKSPNNHQEMADKGERILGDLNAMISRYQEISSVNTTECDDDDEDNDDDDDCEETNIARLGAGLQQEAQVLAPKSTEPRVALADQHTQGRNQAGHGHVAENCEWWVDPTIARMLRDMGQDKSDPQRDIQVRVQTDPHKHHFLQVMDIGLNEPVVRQESLDLAACAAAGQACKVLNIYFGAWEPLDNPTGAFDLVAVCCQLPQLKRLGIWAHPTLSTEDAITPKRPLLNVKALAGLKQYGTDGAVLSLVSPINSSPTSATIKNDSLKP